jgi:hypothetical protein
MLTNDLNVTNVGAVRVTTTTNMVSGLITNTHRVTMPPCIDERCKAIRLRQHANGLDYPPCYTQLRETGHVYD